MARILKLVAALVCISNIGIAAPKSARPFRVADLVEGLTVGISIQGLDGQLRTIEGLVIRNNTIYVELFSFDGQQIWVVPVTQDNTFYFTSDAQENTANSRRSDGSYNFSRRDRGKVTSFQSLQSSGNTVIYLRNFREVVNSQRLLAEVEARINSTSNPVEKNTWIRRRSEIQTEWHEAQKAMLVMLATLNEPSFQKGSKILRYFFYIVDPHQSYAIDSAVAEAVAGLAPAELASWMNEIRLAGSKQAKMVAFDLGIEAALHAERVVLRNSPSPTDPTKLGLSARTPAGPILPSYLRAPGVDFRLLTIEELNHLRETDPQAFREYVEAFNSRVRRVEQGLAKK